MIRYALMIVFALSLGLEVALAECDTKGCVRENEYAEIERTTELIENHHSMEIVAPLDLLGGYDYLCILLRFKIEIDGTVSSAETVRSEPHPLLLRSALYSLYQTTFTVPEVKEDRWGLLQFELRASDFENDGEDPFPVP